MDSGQGGDPGEPDNVGGRIRMVKMGHKLLAHKRWESVKKSPKPR